MSARIRAAHWLRAIADRLYHNRAIHVAVSYDEHGMLRFFVFGVERARATVEKPPFMVEAWADHSGWPTVGPTRHPEAVDAVRISDIPRLVLVRDLGPNP